MMSGKQRKSGSARELIHTYRRDARHAMRAGVAAGVGIMFGREHMRTSANVSRLRPTESGDKVLLCDDCGMQYDGEPDLECCPECGGEVAER